MRPALRPSRVTASAVVEGPGNAPVARRDLKEGGIGTVKVVKRLPGHLVARLLLHGAAGPRGGKARSREGGSSRLHGGCLPAGWWRLEATLAAAVPLGGCWVRGSASST